MVDQISNKISNFDSRAFARLQKAKLTQIAVSLSNDGSYISSLNLLYTEELFQFEEEKSRQISKLHMHEIKIAEKEYLKSVLYKTDQGFITYIEFTIADSDDQQRVETVGVNDNPEYAQRKFEATMGYQISGMKCVKSSFLILIECDEDLMPKFQPNMIVSTIQSNLQRVVSNYLQIYILLEKIPKQGLVSNKQFQDDYTNLKLEVDTLIQTKLNISDDLQEIDSTFKGILNKYKQLSQAISNELSKAYGKFSLKKYYDQKKTLEQYISQLNQILDKFSQHEQIVRNLRNQKAHKKLKEQLPSQNDIYCMSQVDSSDSFLTIESEKNQLQQLLDEKETLEQQLFSSEKFLKLHEDNLEILYNSITQSDNQISYLKQKKMAGVSNQVNYAVKDLENFGSASDLDAQKKLQQWLQTSLEKLSNNYDLKKQAISDKIQQEVNKMQSTDSQNGGSNPMKKLHIVIIADESGSMSGNWASVSQTVDNFIAHFATTDDQSHLFSVILFDNDCRYHAKKEMARNVKKLPNLQSGGTNYGPAIKMGSNFVDITPSGYTPVIVFMTDGQPQDNLKQSLEELTKSSKKPNFMFFAVGFGHGYRKDILNELSNAGNNNRQGFSLGKKDIKFVYDAINDEALQQVFDIFQQNFDFIAQENTIEVLQKQLKREENEFDSQSDFFTKLYEKKKLNMQNDQKQIDQFKQMSIQEKQSNFATLLENQISNIMIDKVACQEKIKTFEQQRASIQATQNKYVDLLGSKKKQIENLQIKMNQSEEKKEELVKKQDEAFQIVLQDSGFTSQKQMGDFHEQLTYIESVLQSLMNVIKESRILAQTLVNKIKELSEKFKPRRQKIHQEAIDKEQLLIGLKTVYPELDNKSFKINSFILTVLEKQDKDDFQKNLCYYKPILDNVILMQLARADEKEIPKIAKKLCQELIVKDKKSKKSDSDSDSDNSESQSSEEESDSESSDEDLSCYFNDKDRGKLPETTKEIKKQKKEAKNVKKQLREELKSLGKKSSNKSKKSKKKEQDSDSDSDSVQVSITPQEKDRRLKEISAQLLQVKVQLKFLDSLQNPKVFQKKIKICLKNINEIIQKVYGNQLKKEFFEDFKSLFQTFGNDVIISIKGISESNDIFKIDGKNDLEAQIKKHSLELPASNQTKALEKDPFQAQGKLQIMW